MKPTRQAESGQIMVILAVGMVALVALTALAIDVGMVYADRRFDQNAADSAALAGAQAAALVVKDIDAANFSCGASNVQTAISNASTKAINRAGANQFTLDTNLSDGHGVQVICSDSVQKYLDVKVMISSQSTTSFLHMFGTATLKNTVTAISRVVPRNMAALGDTIVGLCTTCGDTFDISGNVTIHINTGGIHSNHDIVKNGNGSGSIRVVTGAISAAGSISSYDWQGSTTIPNAAVMAKPKFTKPNCASLTTKTATGGDLTPGLYTNGLTSTANLSSGLYCIRNGIRLNGNDVVRSRNADGTPAYVTIVVLDGDVTLNGNSFLKIEAPANNSTQDVNGALEGMLLYIDEANSCNPGLCLKMNGTNDSMLRGVVFVPNGQASLGGTNDASAPWDSQIIADRITFHGNPYLYINSTAQYNAVFPTTMEMRQ